MVAVVVATRYSKRSFMRYRIGKRWIQLERDARDLYISTSSRPSREESLRWLQSAKDDVFALAGLRDLLAAEGSLGRSIFLLRDDELLRIAADLIGYGRIVVTEDALPRFAAPSSSVSSGAGRMQSEPVDRPAQSRRPAAPVKTPSFATPVAEITGTRGSGESGFDERKMYAIFARSKTAVALEKEMTKLGYKYTGDVTDHGYSAYTDPKAKEIRINKNKTAQEAALSYAYELQNAKNGPHYNAIFDDARSGLISDRAEFAQRIMNYEAEAIENRAKIAIELGLEDTQPRDVVAAVRDVADPVERKRLILQWADSEGKIQDTSPSEHYKKMFDDNFAKKK